MPLQSGATFGPYTVTAKIGEGSMTALMGVSSSLSGDERTTVRR